MEGFMGYMEKSIYGLMQTVLYYGINMLKTGIGQQLLVKVSRIEFQESWWNILWIYANIHLWLSVN
jgi:hypothetical protein